MVRIAAAAAAAAIALSLAQPAAAQLDALSLGEDNFIGIWALESAAGCAGGQGMLVFYRSGAWVFYEGPLDGPFATIGTWGLSADGLVMRASDHDRPTHLEEALMPLLAADSGRIELEDDGRAMAFQRCG